MNLIKSIYNMNDKKINNDQKESLFSYSLMAGNFSPIENQLLYIQHQKIVENFFM